jgi:small subunit ribosomal protein S9
MPEASEWVFATGRRKTAVARIRIRPVKLETRPVFIVNGRRFEQYFFFQQYQYQVLRPLNLINGNGKYDIVVRVHGSGLSSQADAVCLGIARGLVQLQPECKQKLKDHGLLKRDPRMVERKKYGLHKARKAPQYHKR